MATRYQGAWKVVTVNPVPVGTGVADFGANVTLVPDTSVDTLNNNSYIDPSASSPIANWPGSMPHGSITLGVLTKAATAFFPVGTQCTLTIAIP